MTTQKAALVALLSFVGTTAVMLFVCANAHIDFFPCTKTEFDFTRTDPATGQAQLVTRDGTCSLMGHLRPSSDGEKEELSPVGWALLLVFCMGVATADSALLYVVLSNKAKQAQAGTQQA